MKILITLFTSIILLGMSLVSFASEPIFSMPFRECKLITAASANLISKQDSITVNDMEPFSNLCTRKQSKINCEYFDSKGKSYGKQTLDVTFESPKVLEFGAKSSNEHYMIDLQSNTVSTATVNDHMLPVGKTIGVATKICTGYYLSPEEYEKLKKRLNK